MRTRRQSARSPLLDSEATSPSSPTSCSEAASPHSGGGAMYEHAYEDLMSCSEALSDVSMEEDEGEHRSGMETREIESTGMWSSSSSHAADEREDEDRGDDDEEDEEGGGGGGGREEQSVIHSSSSAMSPSALSLSFLEKTYRMIDGAPLHLASWSLEKDSFIIFNPQGFAKEVIPQYFRHNKFASFVRQLNFYGFRKLKISQSYHETQTALGGERSGDGGVKLKLPSEKEWWQFRHERFICGKKELLPTIKRRTYHPSTSATRKITSCTSSPRSETRRQERYPPPAKQAEETESTTELSSYLHCQLQGSRGVRETGRKRKSNIVDDLFYLQESIPSLLATVRTLSRKVKALSVVFRARVEKIEASRKRQRSQLTKGGEATASAESLLLLNEQARVSSLSSSCQSPQDALQPEQPTVEPIQWNSNTRQPASRAFSSSSKETNRLSSLCKREPQTELHQVHLEGLSSAKKCSDTLLAAEVLVNFWCLSAGSDK